MKTYAPVVTRRTPTFPSRNARYFDCTKYGSGYHRVNTVPGACVLNQQGLMLDLRTGEIYTDERFKTSQ